MRLMIVLLAALLGACAAAPERHGEPPQAAFEMFAQRYPLSAQQRATTSASIYLGNLDARIDVLEAQLHRDEDAGAQGSLAGALLLRFRVVGRAADGERALELAARAASAAPDQPDVHLLHAAALSAFHHFAEAENALALAQAAGGSEDVLTRLRRDLWMAQGRYDRLRDDFARSGEPVADFYELAHRADLRLMQGDLQGASHWYRAAQDLYHDVDPLPLAWLYSQQGIALLRHGRCDQAKAFFEAAYQRLPEYYLASEHLAECEAQLGNTERARKLYRAVIAQTGNPEFMAALADLEEQAGRAEIAAAARKDAEDGYRALLDRQPAAYAQHAAEFLLDAGKADEALALARDNLALRQDVGSLILMASAAAAAGQQAEACAAAARVRASGLQPPELGEIAGIEMSCKATGSL
jgi:tetratricopeptide (TPR) repeat protein